VKILFDHQIFSAQIYGGISRYFCELMRSFKNENEIEYELSLRYSNNHYLKRFGNLSYKSFFKNLTFRGKYRLLNFFNQKKSIAMLKKQDFDIFHPTYYNPYFLNYIGSKPFVLTIYDMIHEMFPEMFSAKDKTSEWKKLLAKKAERIIAISENTKRDIVQFHWINEQKIDVIYLGNSLHIAQKSLMPPMKLPDKYLLYVGDRHLYKNFNAFIRAVAPLLYEDETLNIVCAGGKRFTEDEKILLAKMKIDKQIHHCLITSDDHLGYLYSNAVAFIFPSLYEGFGIPILEAFSCGCPVVLSNTSSLPEVAGDAAEYFDPNNITSIRESVYKVINNSGLITELKRRGFEQLKKYSWDKAAKDTLKVYESIL